MKKLFLFVACAGALLTGCSQKEYTPSGKPENVVEPSEGISFVIADNENTKAEYFNLGTDWGTFWYGEEDQIGVFSKNIDTWNADEEHGGAGAAFNFTTKWNSARTNDASDISQADLEIATNGIDYVSYKATQSKTEGNFTGKNENAVLKFGADAPSVRVVWPVDWAVGAKYTAAATGDDYDELLINLPDLSNQEQSDKYASSNVKYNVMVAEEPTKLDGIQIPLNHETVGQSIPLHLERQFPVFYTSIKNYTEENQVLLGDFEKVVITMVNGTEAPVYFAFNAAKMDIMYKYDADGEKDDAGEYVYTVPTVSKINRVELSLATDYDYNEEASVEGEKLYITVDNGDIPVGTIISVGYHFENAVITDKKDALTNVWSLKKNLFYSLNADGSFDIDAQPYLVVKNSDGTDTYSLIINSAFGNNNIATTIFNAGLTDVKVPGTTETKPVVNFTKIVSRLTRDINDEGEVAALKKLTAITDATFYSSTLTHLPVFTDIDALTSLNLPNITVMSNELKEDINLQSELASLSMKSLLKVPEGAFVGLNDLSQVSLDSATEFEDNEGEGSTFSMNNTVIKYITSGVVLTSGGRGNDKIANFVYVPALEKVGYGAFRGLANLESATLDFVTSIGSRAFWAKEAATGTLSTFTLLSIPAIETSGIETDAFGLTQPPYKTFVPNITSLDLAKCDFENLDGREGAQVIIRTHLLSGANKLVSANLSAVKRFYDKDAIPTIGVKLEGFTALEKVIIGAEGVEIHNNAFKGCTALMGIDLAGASVIGEGAFENCTNLQGESEVNKELKINVTPGKNAFKSAGTASAGFAKVTFGPNVNEIPEGLFNGAGNNFEIVGMNNIKKIGKEAFASSNVVSGVNLSYVNSIGESAFEGCDKLQGVYEANRDANIMYIGTKLTENFISEIPASAFKGCKVIEIYDVKADGLTVGENAFNQPGRIGERVLINFLCNSVTIHNTNFINLVADGAVNFKEDNTSTPSHTINFNKNCTLNGSLDNIDVDNKTMTVVTYAADGTPTNHNITVNKMSKIE